MGKQILQLLEDQLHWVYAIMLAIQVLAIVSIVLIGLFVALAGGGLDIMEFDLPGLSETCILLPFIVPFTMIIVVSYPKLKGWKFTKWLLIFTIILNCLLTIPIMIIFYLFFFVIFAVG